MERDNGKKKRQTSKKQTSCKEPYEAAKRMASSSSPSALPSISPTSYGGTTRRKDRERETKGDQRERKQKEEI